MSLAQGIQIGLLGNGVIDNYAACTASNKKKKNPTKLMEHKTAQQLNWEKIFPAIQTNCRMGTTKQGATVTATID
jgi:hypothetical protein